MAGPLPTTLISTVSWASACRALGSLVTFTSRRWTLLANCSILSVFSSAYSRNRSDTVTLRPVMFISMVSSY